MRTRNKQISDIHISLINGQRKQAVKQMDEYLMYDFFEDYCEYIDSLYKDPEAKYQYLKDAATSYFRIKNR